MKLLAGALQQMHLCLEYSINRINEKLWLQGYNNFEFDENGNTSQSTNHDVKYCQKQKSDHPRPFTQDLTIIKSHFVKVQAWSTIHVENVIDDIICVL